MSISMNAAPRTDGSSAFGPRALQHFPFDPEWRNLNCGSFGCIPRAMQERLHHYEVLSERQPDRWIWWDQAREIDESRAAVAELLRCPVDDLVFVPNATQAANTVLRNLVWGADGRTDEILHFSTIYGALGKTVHYVADSVHPRDNGDLRVAAREIPLKYPCPDSEIISRFAVAVAASRACGRNPRICMFDTVSSSPGVRFPFEQLTAKCRELGVMSLVDGAQGIGMFDIDLAKLDPDFFLSNCHKWLHVPRGCAVLVVPRRNQDLMHSTLPTSFAYAAKPKELPPGYDQTLSVSRGLPFHPLPQRKGNRFVGLFDLMGTFDKTPFCCVKDAIAWRKATFGSEANIHSYVNGLARAGGRRMAEILGTEVLDNDENTMSQCSMANIVLPLRVLKPGEKAESGELAIEEADASVAGKWMQEKMTTMYKTFMPLFFLDDKVWIRISSQVYLDMTDFEWAAQISLDLCKRMAAGEWKGE